MAKNKKAVKGWAVCVKPFGAVEYSGVEGQFFTYITLKDAEKVAKSYDRYVVIPCLITFPISKGKK